jgi:hypothetical protein
MVVEKASGRDSPLRQGAGKSSWILRSRDDTAAACSMFRGKEICSLGFSRRGELIGARAASEGGPGRLTPWWHEPGLGHATLGCGQLLAPLRLIFGLREASVKIEGLAFVSSNSENISCLAFLKHKNSRKQGTGTVASR